MPNSLEGKSTNQKSEKEKKNPQWEICKAAIHKKSRMLSFNRQPVMSRRLQMKRNESAMQVMKETKL